MATQLFKLVVEDGFSSKKYEGKITLHTDRYEQTATVYDADANALYIRFTRMVNEAGGVQKHGI